MCTRFCYHVETTLQGIGLITLTWFPHGSKKECTLKANGLYFKKFEISEPKVKTAHVQNRTFEKITNKASLSLKNEISETIALGLKKIHKACQNKYTPLRDIRKETEDIQKLANIFDIGGQRVHRKENKRKDLICF